jgi:hypothetical protein
MVCGKGGSLERIVNTVEIPVQASLEPVETGACVVAILR